MLINPAFTVESFDGKRPYDGAPMMLMCDDKGLALVSIRGFKKTVEMQLNPTRAKLHKVGPGQLNFWTGRHHGDWEVDVFDSVGLTRFRMKNKSQALGLISWIEKYAKRKAKKAQTERTADTVASSDKSAVLSSDGQYRAYLANLCYRLGYLRGRATVEEVDQELDLIVKELRSVLGGDSK